MVYVGFSNITGLPDDAIQGLADQAASGVDREQVVAQLEEIVNADPGAGLYVGTAGAVLGLVGGILSLRPGPRPEAPSQLPPGWTPPDQGGKETPTEPRGEAEVPMEPWRRSEPVSPEREI
jgi:hypothetical protein